MAKVLQPIAGVKGQIFINPPHKYVFAYETATGTPGVPPGVSTWPDGGQRIPHPSAVV